jgi:hypothetical protein
MRRAEEKWSGMDGRGGDWVDEEAWGLGDRALGLLFHVIRGWHPSSRTTVDPRLHFTLLTSTFESLKER